MNYSSKNTISQQKADGPSDFLGITQSSGLDFQELLNCPKRDARWGAEPQYYEQQGERIYRGVLILAEGREDGVFAYDAGEHFAYL